MPLGDFDNPFHTVGRQVGYTDDGKPILARRPLAACSTPTFVGARHVAYTTDGKPVVARVEECFRGYYENYVNHCCHWPWGVSDRILVQVSRAWHCFPENDTDPAACPQWELIWDGTKWTGDKEFTNGTLTLDLECISDGEGFKDPGTVASDNSAGTVAWSNPGNAAASDDTYATATLTTGQDTERLKATNFGHALPGLASPIGVIVEVEAKADGAGVVDVEVELVIAGTPTGTTLHKSMELTTSDETIVYSHSVSDWGVPSLSPTDVNNSGFGCIIRYQNNSSSTRTVSVDHVRLCVAVDGAFFRLTRSNCVSPSSSSSVMKSCDFPLKITDTISFTDNCCTVPSGSNTGTLALNIHGYLPPLYIARHVGYTADGIPIVAYPKVDCIGCPQDLRCCGLEPTNANAQQLLATFSNLSGTCTCMPASRVLTFSTINNAWLGSNFPCSTIPPECEQSGIPILECRDLGFTGDEQWKNFVYSTPQSGEHAPTSGMCGPLELVFDVTVGGGSYTVTITHL